MSGFDIDREASQPGRLLRAFENAFRGLHLFEGGHLLADVARQAHAFDGLAIDRTADDAGDRFQPDIVSLGIADAVAGLEHVRPEGRGLDLVVERLVLIVGMNEGVESAEVQVLVAALETEKVVEFRGIVGFGRAVIVIPRGIAAGAQREAETALVLNGVLGLLKAGVLTDQHHDVAVVVDAILWRESNRAGRSERRHIGYFHLLDRPVGCFFGEVPRRQGAGAEFHQLLADEFFARAVPFPHHGASGGDDPRLRQADGEHLDVGGFKSPRHLGYDAGRSGHISAPKTSAGVNPDFRVKR